MNDLIGRIISGRYRVDAFLGKGGMAEVYKVWDQKRSVFLAMKILHADLAEDKIFLRRFRREAQTLAKLQHPNIVRFYGLEQDGDLVFILMDYVEGTTLRKEIFQAKGPFSQQRVLEILRPVCAALHYAHQSGFVHCDVKPANIMISANGTTLVSDFGIARMTESATATMVGAGTPAYMSPEQARGENPIPQTDIYALGVMLFEMLTGGERPFTGEHANTTGSTSEKVRWEQMHLNPPSLRKFNPTISSELETVVSTCLEKESSRRYRDVLAFLTSTENSITHTSKSIPSKSETPQPQERPVKSDATIDADPASQSQLLSRRARWVLIPVSILILLVGVLLFSGLSGQNAARNAQATESALAANATAAQATDSAFVASAALATQKALDAGIPYHNDALGISIRYPQGWVYKEQASNGASIVFFAASLGELQKATNSTSSLPNSSVVAIMRGSIASMSFPKSVDTTSSSSMRDYFIGSSSSQTQTVQALETRQLNINGNDAAEGFYAVSDATKGIKAELYVMTVALNNTVVLFLGVSPDNEWAVNKEKFSQMAGSLSLSPMTSPSETPPLSSKTLKIVSDLPMIGASLTQTLTIVNAEQLRLAQANNQACGGRYRLAYEAWDDASATQGQWDPAVETENGNKAATDPSIIAYLGTFNSGAAKLSIPILDQAGPLVMISPANTYPGLTKPGYGQGEPAIYYPANIRNYARVVPADDVQGKVDANFMFTQLGVKSVYILDDQQLYGKGVADVFESTAKSLGMNVLAHEGIDTKAADYKALMAKISTSNNGNPPDGIFVGMVIDSNAAQLLKDKVAIMGDNTKVKFMGPDGIQTQAMIDGAGKDIAEGVYASVAGVPLDKLGASGQQFVKDYEAKYGKLTEPYAVYGYETMNVLLKAIENVCASGGDPSNRKAVRDAVFAIKDFNGVLGTWSFDANGDTTLTDMTIYQAKSGAYTAVGTFK